ncbi:hypothetical protein CWC18_01025 [Pseudoalteromonas aurantia]|uniref:hypothetical protein n=1 Tax=Pseudoalteromonas aurantia TaxID=43654 RepID=UPI00110B286A|nr:hypothetical protein [Pseudoalteromonas aurantia]TMO67265.1 hypothetical protein CWC18_01025 [Pseudoalteromonas aurantia]
MNQRSTLVRKVLECLTSGLDGIAQVGLLKPSMPYPDLTQVAQVCVQVLAERQASELQAKGADAGVTYGPTSNKNLSPNPLDRRVLTLQLDLEVEHTDSDALLTRLDGVIERCEALMQADDMATPWQFFIPYNIDFAFTKQPSSVIGKATLTWQFYYQVEILEVCDLPPISEVYLGPEGGEHWLIAKTPAAVETPSGNGSA